MSRPGLLSPEAAQLIDGQYADRPHLNLADVDPALVAEAMRPGSRLVARVGFTGAQVHPGPVWSVDHS
jgi:hypothetical protein